MAGRKKLTPKKIENLGLSPLNNKIGHIVGVANEEIHPMEALMNDPEFMQALENETWDDFKKDAIIKLKLLHKETLGLTIRNITKIPAHRLPYALEMIGNQIAKLQGEPSQRIEVTRGKMTHEEFNELYKMLPKATEVEVMEDGLDGGTNKTKRITNDGNDGTRHMGATDSSDQSKG